MTRERAYSPPGVVICNKSYACGQGKGIKKTRQPCASQRPFPAPPGMPVIPMLGRLLCIPVAVGEIVRGMNMQVGVDVAVGMGVQHRLMQAPLTQQQGADNTETPARPRSPQCR